VQRGSASTIRYRWAMIVLASSSGNTVPAIARLVAADEDTVRDVIHAPNEMGLRCLDPRWAGHRARQLSKDQEDYVVAVASERPGRAGAPFTRWSVRKLQAHLAADMDRPMPATYHRTHGATYVQGCYSVGTDQFWGINRLRKARSTPCSRSRASDGRDRPKFTMAHSHRAHHAEQTRDLHAYLTWRNAHSRHPDVLAAARRERARARSEKGLCWEGATEPTSPSPHDST
jgi:transposase